MDSARAAHSDAAETTDSEAGGRCQLGFTLSVIWQLRGIHRFSVPLLLTGRKSEEPGLDLDPSMHVTRKETAIRASLRLVKVRVH